MKRTLAIDYGGKRCGLAISDPLGMIANGLDTEPTSSLLNRLKKLSLEKPFDTIVVGKPTRMNGEPSEIESAIQSFITNFSKTFSDVKVVRWDERFTSKMAMESMIAAGATKKQRREKGNIDKVSATLILQEYLNQNT